jgi:hypothetical protein
MSAAPPGGNEITILIGLFGYCARTASGQRRVAANAATPTARNPFLAESERQPPRNMDDNEPEQTHVIVDANCIRASATRFGVYIGVLQPRLHCKHNAGRMPVWGEE